jgi:ribosomal protein S15
VRLRGDVFYHLEMHAITERYLQHFLEDCPRKHKCHSLTSICDAVARLTTRITQLAEHMRIHKKDYASRRGLEAVIAQRRALLQYLRRKDFGVYAQLISRLGLRDTYAKLVSLITQSPLQEAENTTGCCSRLVHSDVDCSQHLLRSVLEVRSCLVETDVSTVCRTGSRCRSSSDASAVPASRAVAAARRGAADALMRTTVNLY